MNTKIGRACAFCALVAAAVVASAQDIGVVVNGSEVNFNGTGPRYIDGRVLVPLRGVFENMGANVHWTSATRTVDADKGNSHVSLTIGEKWASVNGKTVAMDVPAMIIDGSTMVPIRFVSVALGADVSWSDSTRTVMISTSGGAVNVGSGSGSGNIVYRNRRKFTMAAGTVIPVELETPVSSRNSRRGDLVRARIMDFNQGPVRYDRGDFDFPNGSRVEGRVVAAIPRNGNRAGLIEMSFGRIILPDGRAVNIDGSLISLDGRDVVRNGDGVYVARGNSRDNRMVYAGYGAGAGLLVGILTKRPLESLAVGGILGYLAGSVEQSQRRYAGDVNLGSGTRFGIRLDRSITMSLPIR
jgi:hypothetical protein